MSLIVLSVGQCGPDHVSICGFLNQHFDVEILTAELSADTQQQLSEHAVDLVLINRKLDADYSDGMNILRAIRTNPETADVPVMIVSNFDDAQQKAVAEGAVYGFGKTELNSDQARERVEAVLSAAS